VQLRVSDLISASGVKRRVMILQQKTGRPLQFEITEQARRSVAAWIEAKQLRADNWLFPSRLKRGCHLSTRQYARLVDKWVTLVGLDPTAYGTHSLRRTKVALLYKKTGNLRACQLLLGHTKLESTVRNLGVEWMMPWSFQRRWSSDGRGAFESLEETLRTLVPYPTCHKS
jgi:site-specific recombinase XerC